jgi:ring-1,2-phenylacetyl-CoA epoxidase subunit PaaC
MTTQEAFYQYIVRLGDDSLILGQRISEWCGHGPILEEDIALTNIALDLIGQTNNLYELAVSIENKGNNIDQLAFLRLEKEYSNLLLVEQPNVDFGYTIVRQFFFDVYRKLVFESLCNSTDERLAGIAEKSLKETKYHLKHSSEWVIRLGDGTEESHRRVQEAVNTLWKFTDELFYQDEVDQKVIELGLGVDNSIFKATWNTHVEQVLTEATLTIPTNSWQHTGGRKGIHTEHFGYLLSEMQYMQRAYPNMEW